MPVPCPCLWTCPCERGQEDEEALEELSDLSEDEEASPIHQPPPDAAGGGRQEEQVPDEDPALDATSRSSSHADPFSLSVTGARKEKPSQLHDTAP